MKYKKMTIGELKSEILKCKQNINNYNEALNYIPINSVLGRMSIDFSIRYENKKLEKLNNELQQRNVEITS